MIHTTRSRLCVTEVFFPIGRCWTNGNDNRCHASCSVACNWSLFFVWVQKCSLNYIIRFILCTGRRRDQLLLVNSLLKQHRTKSSRTFLRGNSQWQRKRLGSWFVEIHFDCSLLRNQLSSVSEARERVESMGMSLFIQWPWSVFNIHSLKSIVDVMISTSRLSWSWYTWPCAVSFANKYCLLCSKLAKNLHAL